MTLGLVLSSMQAYGRVWGPTENGLRMSTTIVRDDSGFDKLEVTIANTTSKEILIVLGRLQVRFAENIHVIVKPPNSPEVAAFYLNQYGGGVARGRELPMVMPMLPKSEYSVRTLLDGWGYNGPSIRRVADLLIQKSSLRVEFRNTDDERTKNGIGTAVCYGSRPFWNGTLISNVIEFPLATPPKSTNNTPRERIVRDLYISAAFLPNDGNQLELNIFIHNTGLREYILAIGRWGFLYPTAIRLYIQTPKQASASEVQWPAGGMGTKIRDIPLILPILPSSTYRVRTPIKNLRLCTDEGVPFPQKSLLHAELSIPQKTYIGLDVDCYPGGVPPPPSSRRATGCEVCWTGRLVSNRLHLPLPW
jgi:hypothetical protein